MTDHEKEFYAHLGLLSIQFSKMEYKLAVIVGELIGTKYDQISVTITDQNNLHQNMGLLKKFSDIRDIKEEELDNLYKKVDSIRANRNLFIHGIWGEPFETENEIKIVCEERKIKYREELNDKKEVTAKHWTYNKHHVFELTTIKNLIQQINEILETEDELIDVLKDEKYL